MNEYRIAAIHWLEENGVIKAFEGVKFGVNPTAIIGYCVNRREINCHLNMYAKRYGLVLPSWLTGEIPDCGN